MDILREQSIQTATETLVRDGFVRVHFRVDELIAPVIAGWLNFLDLPDSVKMRWCVGEPADPDDGLVVRSGEERHDAPGTYDRKSVFQFKGMRRLGALLRQHEVEYSDDIAAWLALTDTLHAHCVGRIKDFGGELDRQMPGFDFAGGIQRATEQDMHCLRLLCYDEPQKIGDEVAKDHIDRNFITLHLDESHKGLDVRCAAKTCVAYAKSPQEILVFTGAKADHMTSGKLRPVGHGVFAKEDFVGKKRWAIIFFGHTDAVLPKDYFEKNKVAPCN